MEACDLIFNGQGSPYFIYAVEWSPREGGKKHAKRGEKRIVGGDKDRHKSRGGVGGVGKCKHPSRDHCVQSQGVRVVGGRS